MRLRNVSLILILHFWGLVAGAQTHYLDIEDDQIVSIFNAPGHNWKTCTKSNLCEPVAWPDNKATLRILGPAKKVKTLNPYTDKMVDEDYLPVEYEYKRNVNGKIYHQKGQGWIDAAYVTDVKRDSFFTESPTEAPLDCNCAPGEAKPYEPPAQSTRGMMRALGNHAVVDYADQLDQIVGECAIDNPQKPKLKSGNAYDAHVLPKLKNKPLPNITNEFGTPITRADLINIDALARTMYGEMANCYKHGLQYPMTVARIAVNRADDVTRHGEFIRGDHASQKGDLAKVVTSVSQFSVWQKNNSEGGVNGPLLMALCPPQQQGKKFWKSGSAPRDEYDIWKNTVRIATEAVLFPNRFKNRTIKINEFFYTSGLGEFYNMTRVHPTIEGRKIARNSCVEVWRE